ncbi:MAG: flagellar assembly protein FliW [Candidatus Zixiibacteriota bacterium]
MEVRSSRFGSQQVPPDKIITMERPVLGFESLKTFCLLEREEYRPFVWMQSTDQPEVAFVLANPLIFFPDYHIEVHSKEIAELGVTSPSSVETWVIITIPEDPKEMSANLQGPIIINAENRKAKQLVLVNSDYSVRHELFSAKHSEPTVVRSRDRELVGV